MTNFKKTVLALGGIALMALAAVFLLRNFLGAPKVASPNPVQYNQNTGGGQPATAEYPVHKNITVSMFWVGESADHANNFISNAASAWDENWLGHFGGEDTPDSRNGFLPVGFTPKENPFYFALPYNDLDESGGRKSQAPSVIYWAQEGNWPLPQSMCKNQWIKITKNNSSAYAQWEDVGPFGEDDPQYVFGSSPPGNTQKSGAGLDVSPAVRDYLGLSGIDNASWQFIRKQDVPAGPWKQIVTTRNGN